MKSKVLLVASLALVFAVGAAVWTTSGAEEKAGNDKLLYAVASEPLTTASFKPFGQIIEVADGARPTMQNAVVKYWAGLAKTRIHEQMEVGLFLVMAREHEVAELERHMKTPELLVSLDSDYFLVVGPPATRATRPDVTKVRVFTVRKHQAVMLHKGTWHALPFPREDEGLFLVAYREGTAKKDQKERQFKGKEVVKF